MQWESLQVRATGGGALGGGGSDGAGNVGYSRILLEAVVCGRVIGRAHEEAAPRLSERRVRVPSTVEKATLRVRRRGLCEPESGRVGGICKNR